MQKLLENDPVLTSAEAAAYLGITRRTLESWKSRNIGPNWIVYSRCAHRYRLSVLNAFLLTREHQTTRYPALSGGRFPVIKYGRHNSSAVDVP